MMEMPSSQQIRWHPLSKLSAVNAPPTSFVYRTPLSAGLLYFHPPVHGCSTDSRCAGCDLRPELCALLCHWPLDGRPFHLAFVIDYHAGVVLKINPNAFAPPPGLLLADHDAFQHLLPQFRLALLAGAEHHVAGGTVGHLVQAATNANHCHDVQILGTTVVRAIHQCCHAQAKGHAQLAATLAATTTLHLSSLMATRWRLVRLGSAVSQN